MDLTDQDIPLEKWQALDAAWKTIFGPGSGD